MTVAGKRVVLTGATSGIGRAAAFALAKRGAQLALVCRDGARGEALRQELAAMAPQAHHAVHLADLGSQAQLRALTDALLAAYPRIDALLHNAGAMFAQRQTSADGIELTWATNHLAPFLLTHLLLPRLIASAPARIVTVASGVQAYARLNFDDLERRRRYRMFDAYGQSKLANVMFTYELARRLQGTGVTANCLHPGVVRTALFPQQNLAMAIFLPLVRPFFLSPEAGARTLVYLADSPEVEGHSGGYYIRCKPARTQKITHDAAACQRLWQASCASLALATDTP